MLALFLSFCLFVTPAPAENLAAADAVLARAGSFENFINSMELRREYYDALAPYYGGADRFPRLNYEKTLEQLSLSYKSVPGFGERLWETNGLGTPFEITVDSRGYGRTLGAKEWRAYWDGEVARHLGDAGELAKTKPEEARKRVLALEKELTAAIAAKEAEWASLPRRAREERQADYYKSLRARPDVRAATAYLAAKGFGAEALSDPLNSGDADLILDTLAGVRENVGRVLDAAKIAAPTLGSLLRERVPATADLLKNETLFPIEKRLTNRGRLVPVGRSAATTYRFTPIPRRMHGIFKGIPLRECVGGGNCEAVSLERLATVALAGTELYHVERVRPGAAPGEEVVDYDGFIQHVPLRNERTGEVSASTDFGAPALRRKVAGGDGRRLYDLWLTEKLKRLPPEWRGLLVGESLAINNAGVVSQVREHPSYLLGEEVGEAGQWEHPDPLASTVVYSTTRDRYGYGGRMILDGTVRTAGTLTRLVDPDAAGFEAIVARAMREASFERKKLIVAHADGAGGPLKEFVDAAPNAGIMRRASAFAAAANEGPGGALMACSLALPVLGSVFIRIGLETLRSNGLNGAIPMFVVGGIASVLPVGVLAIPAVRESFWAKLRYWGTHWPLRIADRVRCRDNLPRL